MTTTPRIEPLMINEYFVILDHEKEVAYSLTDPLKAGFALMMLKDDPDKIYRSAVEKSPHIGELYAAIQAERASGELTPTDGTADTQPND